MCKVGILSVSAMPRAMVSRAFSWSTDMVPVWKMLHLRSRQPWPGPVDMSI